MLDPLELGRQILQKEAQALTGFVSTLDGSFVQACEMVHRCEGTVLLTGMGKSGLVARKWASTLSGTGTKSHYINPAEARHGDLGMVRKGDLLIALSFSGETEELGPILTFARESGVPSIGITRNLESSVARQTQVMVSVEIPEEACPLGLAPTTSTTIMMALGDAIAVTVMQMRGFSERDFARLHPGGSLGRKLWLRVRELMHAGNAMPIVRSNSDLKHVLLEMSEKRLGLAVVIDDGPVKGIITDGDLRRYFQKNSFQETSTASELMTAHPLTIEANALAIEARGLMESGKIQHLLVMENQQMVGVLHFHDLLRAKVL